MSEKEVLKQAAKNAPDPLARVIEAGILIWTAVEIGAEVSALLNERRARRRQDLEESERARTIEALRRQKEEMSAQGRRFNAQSDKKYEDYRAQTVKIIDHIHGMRYRLFLPDCLSDIQELLDRASTMKRQKMDMAALQLITQAYVTAQEHWNRLMKLEEEWQQVFQETEDAYWELSDQMDLCARWPVEVSGPHGQRKESIDINYWTDGGLDALREDLPLALPDNNAPTEKVRGALAELLEGQRRLDALRERGITAFLDWQQRVARCRSAYAVMRRRGWRLRDDRSWGYTDGDKRLDTFLIMTGPTRATLEFRFPSLAGGASRAIYRSSRPGSRENLDGILSDLSSALAADGFPQIEIYNNQ